MRIPRGPRGQAPYRQLTEKQRRWCALFIGGPDGLRGDAYACGLKVPYRASYCHTHVTQWGKACNREDAYNKAVWDELHRLRTLADNKVVRKLRDWTELAVDSQQLLAQVQAGFVTYVQEDGTVVRAMIKDGMRAKIADTMMRAATEILDRALGKAKQSHEVTGRDGGPVEVDWRAELTRRLAAVAGRCDAGGVPGEPEQR